MLLDAVMDGLTAQYTSLFHAYVIDSVFETIDWLSYFITDWTAARGSSGTLMITVEQCRVVSFVFRRSWVQIRAQGIMYTEL